MRGRNIRGNNIREKNISEKWGDFKVVSIGRKWGKNERKSESNENE